jgi:hypothetical protein
VTELDGVDHPLRPHHVGHVADGGAAGGAKVQDLAARRHVYLVNAAQDRGRQLGPEGFPHSVLDLTARVEDLGRFLTNHLSSLVLHGNPLLAVDALAHDHVLGDQRVLLAARDEDPGVSVQLRHHLPPAAHPTPAPGAPPAPPLVPAPAARCAPPPPSRRAAPPPSGRVDPTL